MSQIFYIHNDNPQPRLINQSAEYLNKGGLIAYPTDSGYALGCKFGEKRAIEQMCHIRKIDNKHNFTLMCRDLSEISCYAQMDNTTFRLIKNNTPGRYTFILSATKKVPRRLMNEKRKTIGFRIPANKIALSLLERIGEPIMSTSLLIPDSDAVQCDPDEIQTRLAHQLDLIIHGGYLPSRPTTIVDLTSAEPIIIREGAGDITPFQV